MEIEAAGLLNEFPKAQASVPGGTIDFVRQTSKMATAPVGRTQCER